MTLTSLQVLNVQVPFMFKYAVDALSSAAGATGATAAASAATSSLLFATPTAVLLGYGIARAGASACNGKLSSKNLTALLLASFENPGVETQSSIVKSHKDVIGF